MEKNWYVVHTYSGYENKVKANLEKRVETMGMEDKIFRVVVPEEEETEIKDGKKKVMKKKVFPGYVLSGNHYDGRFLVCSSEYTWSNRFCGFIWSWIKTNTTTAGRN